MNKKWNKSKITVATMGKDKVVRNRNFANAVENISADQMAELSDIVVQLTGSEFASGKLIHEDGFTK